MKYNSAIIVLISLMCVVTACKTSHKVAEKPTQQITEVKDQRYQSLINTYNDWNSLTVSGKISVNAGKSFTSPMQMKMVRGKSISISVRPLLGIEAGKVYFTSDSVYVLDKLNKRFLAEKISTILPGMPFDVAILQDAILSRAFIIGNGTLTADSYNRVKIENGNMGAWSITPKSNSNQFAYSFKYNAENLLQQILINISGITGNNYIGYSDYKNNKEGIFASDIIISASFRGKEYSLRLLNDVSRMKWNSISDDNLEIGDNYKRISMSSFISILKSM